MASSGVPTLKAQMEVSADYRKMEAELAGVMKRIDTAFTKLYARQNDPSKRFFRVSQAEKTEMANLSREANKLQATIDKQKVSYKQVGDTAVESARRATQAQKAMAEQIASAMKAGGYQSVGAARGAGALSHLGIAAPGAGSPGANPFLAVAADANRAANAVERLGARGKFTIRVLEAFVLYRGFVLLEQSILGSIQALVQLDHQVSLVLTQLPNFGRGMRREITEGIIAVSRDTGRPLEDVAQGLYQITSAGYSGQAALDALALSAKAAVAGGTSIENAFNAAYAQMSAFGLEADSLGNVLDKQFQLVKRGIFSYDQLTAVVGITAEAFAQAGQDINTVNAAMATVSEVFTGPQLARGATALRNLVQAVGDKPGEFRKLGVETRTAGGDIRGLIFILEDLEKQLGGMSTGEKSDRLATILPDDRERAGVLALLQNMDSLKSNYVEQTFALGTLDKAYAVFNRDVQKEAQALKTAVQGGFTPLNKVMGESLHLLNSLEGAAPGAVSGMVAMTTAVTALALAYGYLNKQIVMSNGMTASRGAAFMGAMTSPMMAAPYGPFKAGGPMALGRGRQLLAGVSSPLSVGIGIGGATVGYGMGSASQGSNGKQFNSFLGATAAGAGMGIIGGAPGVAIGAAVGAAGFLIGKALQDDAEPIGSTMAEAFAAQLKTSGDLQEAFAVAVGLAIGDTRSRDAMLGALQGPTNWKGTHNITQDDAFDDTPVLGFIEDIVQAGLKGVDSANRMVMGDERADADLRRTGQIVDTGGQIAGPIEMARQFRGGTGGRLNELNAGAPGALTDSQFKSIYSRSAQDEIGKFYDDILKNNENLDEATRDQLEAAKNFAMALASSTLATEDFAKITEIQNSDMRDDEKLFRITALVNGQGGAGAAAGPKTFEDYDLASNSFADALFFAADGVRRGFLDSESGLPKFIDAMDFTADELEMMGEEFQALNKVVAKVSMLKDLQGIASFLDPEDKKGWKANMDAAMVSLYEGAIAGGESIQEIFNNKDRLIELLNGIQFGDVKVENDNSQDFNFVVNISGGENLDSAAAASFADTLYLEMSKKTRQASA